MKPIIIFLFLLYTTCSFSQKSDSLKTFDITIPDSVSFITTLDISQSTKEGIYSNGYIIHIKYDHAKKLNGKRVSISGEVTVVKGVTKLSPGKPVKQGREGDTKHIVSPVIKIVKEE